MYQLYYYPNNASLAPHFILAELGVDFELLLVDRKSDAQKSKEYLALNPAGRIPTLIDNDLVLFESPAICLHLCEQNPDAGLIPTQPAKDRALFFQWMMYLTNTVQAELMVYFYPKKHTVKESHASEIVTAQEARVTDMLILLDVELEGKNYLVGDRLTACDYFLLMLCFWADNFQRPPQSFPNLRGYLKRLVQRDAVQSVCKTENIDLSPYLE